MCKDLANKSRYSIQDLLDIMKYLRSENGCPWDKVQTHESIRTNFIEETYEVIEAIDFKNSDMLREELGDVLLQVVFHSQIEEEAGTFDFEDVVSDICKKLVIRHPHIFGDVKAYTENQVLTNWDEIKKKTKGQNSQSEVMKSVPKVFPALIRSCKVQGKAAKVGFDWPDINGAFDKLSEETDELKQAMSTGNKQDIKEELGDLLFSVCNVARFLDVDAEEALSKSCDKFIDRFSLVEEFCKKNSLDMKKLSIDELDKIWETVKLVSKQVKPVE